MPSKGPSMMRGEVDAWQEVGNARGDAQYREWCITESHPLLRRKHTSALLKVVSGKTSQPCRV